MNNLDEIIDKLYEGKLLEEKELKHVCKQAEKLFSDLPSVLEIHSPITVCGDIHGQFHDLLHLFQNGGYIPNTNYLFMGDYVDRGLDSIQVISLLLCLKLRYPNRIHMLRGNHESRQVSHVYGFYDECVHKYKGESNMIWKLFTDFFDFLPLAAVIDNEIMCVHGGLSPKIKKIEDINSIERFQEIPLEGPMCDLMWSDPDDRGDWNESPRGAGWTFGIDVSKEFNYHNNLKFISRAHQLVIEGYDWAHERNVVTLFSAPNYCYRCGNKAAIMEVDESLNHTILQFEPSPESSDNSIMKTINPNYFL